MATEIVTRHSIAPISQDFGTEQQTQLEQYKQETSFVLKTRDQTQYVYTIQTNPISQTNHLEHTVTQKKNKTLHNGLALF